MFYDTKIDYTYEEYLEHLELLKDYKKKHKNYNYKMRHNNTFKNINISLLEDSLFIISKENAPSIHFVFNHPSLINAMKSYKCIIKEKD
jgi:arginine utilization protein RocB